jgi:hypothetical protein
LQLPQTVPATAPKDRAVEATLQPIVFLASARLNRLREEHGLPAFATSP